MIAAGTILFSLALGVTSTSEVNDHVNTISHFTASATLHHLGYTVCRRVVDVESKVPCLVTGAVFSAAIGLAKEANDPKFDNRDILTNMGGIGLSVGLISLDF